ncbi:hypothetical protein [Motilibacter aurantiacus]|uniref:hypothetical protein n=1 Tax=Motilibacter aurantiacus TaxID=2714955 RepID=UPI00140CCF3F|nr:hypothetical protein [Motilibacter aurantiacus]NHC45680.1 hypothetical protein [Motilibacter aurantiacus]
MRELLASGADGERWVAPRTRGAEEPEEVRLTPDGEPPDDGTAPAEQPGRSGRGHPARGWLAVLLAAAVGAGAGAWAQAARHDAAAERAADSAVSLVVVGAVPAGERPGRSLDVEVELHNAGPRPVTLLDVRPGDGLEALGKPRIRVPRIEPGARGRAQLTIPAPGCDGRGLVDEVVVRVRTADGTDQEAQVPSNELIGGWGLRCGGASFQEAYTGLSVAATERLDARTTRLVLDINPLSPGQDADAAYVEGISTQIGGVRLRPVSLLPVGLTATEGGQLVVDLTVGRCAQVQPPVEWSQGGLQVHGRMVDSSGPAETVHWMDTPVVVAFASALARACPDLELR